MRYFVRMLGLACLASGLASATTIDFSATPNGCFASYAEAGVTFTAPGGLTSTINGNGPNGTRALSGCASPYQPVTANFAGVFTGVISVDLGDFGDDADSISLSLLNAANAVVGSASASIPAGVGGLFTLSAFGSGVTHVIFGGVGTNGSSVYADNFTFAAPEPGTLLLVAAALGLAIITRARRH